jgi:Uma2 family endonuclease
MATTHPQIMIAQEGSLDEEFIFKQLLDSPRCILFFEEMKHALEAEQKKREQFYAMITEGDKAEFINGEIIMHSPVKLAHNRITRRLVALLDAYIEAKQLGLLGYEKLMISLTRNDYEPDVCFFSREKAEQFEPDQWRFPAPDFIVEVVSDATEERDRGDKFEDYAAHGVTEYWIIDPQEQTVEQYRLQGQQYHLARKLDSGILRSIAITGFAVPVRAIFDDAEKQRTLHHILTAAA